MDIKYTFSKELNNWLKIKGLSQNEFARKIGVSPTTVNNWCNEYKLPRMPRLEQISDFFNVDIQYFLTQYDYESDPAYRLSDCSGPVWDAILENNDYDVEEAWVQWMIYQRDKEHDAESEASRSPLFEAAAGEARTTDWYSSEECSIRLEADEVAVRVVGRSMEPTLLDGDVVVVVAQSITDYPRQIALVKVNGDEATIKRVEIKDNGIMLLADNIDVYSPHFYTEAEVQHLPVEIQGVITRLIRDIK